MKIFGKDILRQVAADHDLTIEEIVGKKKTKKVLAARLDAISRLREMNFTIAQISRLVHRDHSTICHHIYPEYRVRAIARAQNWWLNKGRQQYFDRLNWNTRAQTDQVSA